MNKALDTDIKNRLQRSFGTPPKGVFFSSRDKIEHVKKSDVIFVCHPLAVPAYIAWLALAYDSTQLAVNSNVEEYRIKHPPLPVQLSERDRKLKSKQNVLYFINCFDVFHTLTQLYQNELIPVVNIEDLNEVTIQYRAWLELVKRLFNNKKHPENWVEVLNCINTYMPEDLIRHFFSEKSLTITTLCKHIGISIRQFETKRSQIPPNKAAETEFSFKKIIERARNDTV